MSDKENPNLQLVMKFYDNARQELVDRVRLRDNILSIFLVAVGSIFTFGLREQGELKVNLLLVIPYIAFAVSFLVRQHEIIIGSIGLYCATELEEFVRKQDLEFAQWENSNSFYAYREKSIADRFYGQLLILMAPCLLAMLINLPQNFPANLFEADPKWCIAIAATFAVFLITYNAHQFRKGIYKKLKAYHKEKNAQKSQAHTDEITPPEKIVE